LIAEPITDSELLHNSIVWEFWGYEWQEHAFALEDLKDTIKMLIAP